MIQSRRYIRNLPRGGGFAGFIRQIAGLLPVAGAFIMMCLMLSVIFADANLAKILKIELPAEGMFLLAGAVGALLMAYVCLYLSYILFRKLPILFYWLTAILFFICPLVLLFNFYTNTVEMAETLNAGGEIPERVAALSEFVGGINSAWVIDGASSLWIYAVSATVFLFVAWVLPLIFVLKKTSKYRRLYRLYGNIEKPVRTLTSLEYSIKRHEILRVLCVYMIVQFLFFGAFAYVSIFSREILFNAPVLLVLLSLELMALISTVLLFYRVWSAIPLEISKIKAKVLSVLLFVPVVNIFAVYKFTIGAMRAINRSFESIGIKGSAFNTVFAAVVFAVGILAGCTILFLPCACRGEMRVGILVLLQILFMSKIAFAAVKLLNAFEAHVIEEKKS